MKELLIHHLPPKGKRRARVRVSYRPEPGAQAQERETELKFTITDEQHRLIQWYLEEFLIYPWGEFRNRAQHVEELMARLGEELFEAVFGDRETAALYAHVEDDLANTRIVIHASDPVGIALPWELLRDPARGEYGDLARLGYTFVRSQPDLIFEPPPPPQGDTLNILIVICRPGGPEGDVPFQSVTRPLLELFRPHRDRIHLDVLRPPTFEQLARMLSEKPNYYHILHFDGHGTFPQGGDPTQVYAQAGAQGRLLFEGEEGKPREVTGEELGGLLAGKGVPIVLLNACQSGMTHPESLYPSVGNQLLQAGARGVVAMSYSVYVQTTVRFMARLYEGLIIGEDLARATTLAREGLRSHPQRSSPIGEIALNDWVVPVLFEAAPVRQVERRAPVHLDLNRLHDQQAQAGAEIDCPEPPAFGFVGRDGVMLDLERAFQEETIVLLEGMAGVGKTEMAVGLARWRAETGALGGPIFFFPFEHYLPLSQVCDRVGQVFNPKIREQLGQDWQLLDAEQRRQVALSLLRQVPCLLIWDNLEPVAGFPTGTPSDWKKEEQQELRDFLRDLRGGLTKVLLTSRREEQWLGNIYRRVELGGLKLVEAQELAVRVLKRAGLKPEQIRDLPQYNDLLKYLRGNPLAIQVILPELKWTTPDTLLRALQVGEATLSGDDPQQGRERSLAASLNYRLDALDPTLRKRLGILALFHGFVAASVLASISRDVAGAPDLIRGLGRDDWVRMLNPAAEVGLLRGIGESYYSIHPALPWFLHGLLREAFPDSLDWLERAFCAVYGAFGYMLAELFDSKPQSSIFMLRIEESNLMHALRLARPRRQWKEAMGILYALDKLLTKQGRWVEWTRLIDDFEAEVIDAQGESRREWDMLCHALLGHRAEIAEYRGELETAKNTYLRLKEYYEEIGEERNQAAVLHQLGIIALEQRQYAEAEQWCSQALTIFEEIGAEHGRASVLHQLGRIAHEERKFAEAELWYRQALPIFEEIGAEHEQAIVYHSLGQIAYEQHRFVEAKQFCLESLAIRERITDQYGQGSTLQLLGIIAQEQRQFAEAENWYRQSLAIAERIGGEQGQAATIGQLGNLALAQRRLLEAERWYRQALNVFQRVGDEHGQAVTFCNLGSSAQERGDVAEAVQLFEQAEALLVRLNDPYNLDMVRESLKKLREG